jgi:Fe-S-cluster containining protein
VQPLEATTESLRQYLELRSRVDEKFTEIQTAYSSEMVCRAGCHSCCKPGLTVSELEAAAITDFLNRSPESLARAKAADSENPHKGKRCSFLDGSGSCTIYEARPVVCRSHGVPLQVSVKEDQKVRDVCPLNFKTSALSELPTNFVMNLDTVNVLLSLLNRRAFGKSMKRIPLRIDSLLPQRS